MTYVWAGLGGAGLTLMCATLQGGSIGADSVIVTTLFVFSMHLSNRILERSGALRFNTPEIAGFYSNYEVLLAVLKLHLSYNSHNTFVSSRFSFNVNASRNDNHRDALSYPYIGMAKNSKNEMEGAKRHSRFKDPSSCIRVGHCRSHSFLLFP